MCTCVLCKKKGEKHHIVYKNQGGIDIPLNYIYLCNYHHRSSEGPHKNRKIDIKYKKIMQQKLIDILKDNYYDIKDVSKILEINPRQADILSTQVRKYKLGYKKMDLVKRLMGGKLY